tara:strand:+ start:310 stop:633 length:324 start_codon:yes stop_codon:yes gene_type:complete
MNLKSISAQELKSRLESGEQIQVIDVREPYEYSWENLGALNIPMGDILERVEELPIDGIVVVHCQSGQRATAVCEALERLHKRINIYNLDGGYQAWLDVMGKSQISL